MRYKKYPIGSYNLHVINTDKFKTVTVMFNFKRKLVKEEISYRNLLTDLLCQSSKDYPTSRLVDIKTEELYDMKINGRSYLSGNYAVMSFNGQFLSENYTESGMTDKAITFMCELLFNPNVNKNKFNNPSFTNAKNRLKNKIESYKEYPERYSIERMLEYMDKKSVISYRPIGYLKDLEKINESNLYDYYKSILRSDLLDIYVIGNIDNDMIKKIITEKVPVNILKKPGISHYVNHDKYRKRLRKVKEKEDINQSRLVMGCKLTNLTDFEKKYVGMVYSFILGGGADSKLFKTVREKHSLCYTVHSSIRMVSNLLIIYAGIDRANFDKAVNLIRKEMKKMETGNFSDEDIEKAKITFQNTCKEILDSPYDIINTYVSQEYLQTDLLEERMKQINKVDRDMVIKFSKKVHLDTIYLLEGGSLNAEKNTP